MASRLLTRRPSPELAARAASAGIRKKKGSTVTCRNRTIAAVAVLLGCTALGCSGTDSTSSLPTTPTTSTVNETLVGTVGVPVNGALQSAFNAFSSQAGTVSVTL